MTLSASANRINLDFDAIGTTWHIEFTAPSNTATAVAKMLTKRIQQFDETYSRFRPDSWIQMVGNNPGSHKAPEDLAPMFELYTKLYTATNGAVTPLIGDAMERAGYDRNYSLKPSKLQNVPELDKTLLLEGNTLHVKYKCVIDIGAVGKGYLVDLLGSLLEKQGIANYLIDAGGDILHHSPAPSTPVIIGLENPFNTSQAIGNVKLNNRAICGSSSKRRAWGDMHHIINANSLQPERDIVATWALASTALVADGLATALFFQPPQVFDGFSFEYVILKADKSVTYSSSFSGELFT